MTQLPDISPLHITAGQSPANPDRLLAYLFPQHEESSLLTLEVGRDEYAASVVARAVEDADAHVLNLNVAIPDTPSSGAGDSVRVELRISHRHAEAVARSLERYGFRVVAVAGSDGTDGGDPTTRERVESLLRLLEV